MCPRTASLPLLVLALAAILGPALPAQGLFVEHDPRRPRPDLQAGIPMTRLDYHLDLSDARVELSVEQAFLNQTGAVQEAVYLFPLPRGATATGFELWMNGKPVPAEVLDKDQAAGIYHSIVRRVRDPGLLEYAGQGLLRARIFPLEPGKEARVRVHLAWTAERIGELYSCELPLHVPSGQPTLTVTASCSAQAGLGPVFSPTHELDVVRDGEHRARASYEGKADPGRPRLRLYYGTSAEGPGRSDNTDGGRRSFHDLHGLCRHGKIKK